MDLGSILTGIVLLIICILPFAIMKLNSVKRRKKLMQSIDTIAREHKCVIHTHEFCKNFLIAVDEREKILFILRYDKQEEILSIHLSTIQTCVLIKENRTIQNQSGSYSMIDQLYLSLKPHSKGESEKKLVFYNAEDNIQLSGELESIERWCAKINQLKEN